MPKKKNNRPPREMTKRQLSHWQRENRRQRIIMVSGAILVVAILAIVGTGLFMNKYKPFHVTVIKVGNTNYSMDYYINMLAYYGNVVYGSPQMIPYIADNVAQDIEQNQITIEQAANLGITVSDAQVQQYIKANNLSSNQTRTDAVRAQLVVQNLKDDYFAKQVPASAEQRNVQAMFVESQDEVNVVKARLDKGENFSDIASQLSMETTSKDNKGDFGWVPQGVLSTILNNGNSNTAISDNTLDNLVFGSNTTAGNLTSAEDKSQMKDIGYWLVEVTGTKTVNTTPTPSDTTTTTGTSSASPASTTTTEAHVYTMLLSSEQQAEEIKAKLEKGGTGNDWATLAKAYSQEAQVSTNGGDQGFVSKGTLGDAIDKIVFPDNTSKALPLNTVSNPIPDTSQSTSGGFWLAKVNGIENQKISDSNSTILAQNLLNDWLKKVWTDNQSEVHNLLTDTQKQFAIQQAENR